VREFARDQLSAAKLPREVRVVAEIPRSGSGKPLRRVLRAES
jgi:acyl-CoA synthetase (AMP-forming)/AMP-acid ligase II